MENTEKKRWIYSIRSTFFVFILLLNLGCTSAVVSSPENRIQEISTCEFYIPTDESMSASNEEFNNIIFLARRSQIKNLNKRIFVIALLKSSDEIAAAKATLDLFRRNNIELPSTVIEIHPEPIAGQGRRGIYVSNCGV